MSTPMLPGYDPAKMMEFLGKLPSEKRKELLEEAARQVNDDAQQARQARTREGLIQRFKKGRAQFVRPGGIFADQLAAGRITPDTVQVAFANKADAKPNLDMKSLKLLKPMIVKELTLGTTHRGRFLCGWVAIDDAFFGIASTSLLLEDVTGELVEIAAYGLVDDVLAPHEKQRIVSSRFPKGQPIVVFEPYYKVRQDMSEGIRVEQPKELIPWNDAPRDLATWKKLGNDFFGLLNSSNEGRGALACYERAMQTVAPDVKKLAVLLNNMATCELKLGEFNTAVQLAGAAAHLDPGYVKAWFRLAASLVEQAGGCCLLAQRVVAHACRAIPNLSAKDRRLVENTIGKEDPPPLEDHSLFQSYVGWCADLGAPGVLLLVKGNSTVSGDADAWRKAGSDCFIKGDFRAAEECYQKGLKALNLCSRGVSLVLNNVAAVHLKLHHETSSVPGISVTAAVANHAKTNDEVPSTELALLNCTIAGIVDPLNYKAWTRRARCLQRIGLTPVRCIADLNSIRADVVSKALASAESRDRVQKFKVGMVADVELRSKQSATPKTVQPVSATATDVQRRERDALQPHSITSAGLHEKTKGEDATCGDNESIDQYIARMESLENMMRFGIPASQYQALPREMVMFLEHPPPKIHVEFPKLRGWPEGVDPVFAGKVLHRAYLDASANPWIMAQSMRDGTFKRTMHPGDMVKRWHGTAALQILQSKGASLRYGDIIDARDARIKALPEYDARIRSNFANNPNRAEVYFFGTTHVAIGFNDLSSLACATLHDKANSEGPLRFFGVEMSEFAVAKCKVVAHMLGSPNISILSVMEVWLSSTWSETTLSDFRKCVKAVLECLDEQKENAKVLSYLKYWTMTESISAAKARSEYFLNMERYNEKALLAVCCFRREIDRLDLTEYMLTGEIRASPMVVKIMEEEFTGVAGTKAETSESSKSGKKKAKKKKRNANQGEAAARDRRFGSLTMWNVPPGAPPLEEDIAFNTMEFLDILEEFAERQKKQKSSIHRLSVADLFVVCITRNLCRLRGLMVANKLTIDVMYGVVKAVRGEAANDVENRKLLAQIAALRPYTISWSNVLDYFLPEDFHDLARRCSMHGDCMHYGYSMNWTTQVFGASIIDYDPDESKQLVNATLNTALGFPNSPNASSSSPTDLHGVFKMIGLDKLVSLPFREHPLNGTGYVLAQIYKQHWIDHFVKKGQLTSKAAKRLGSACTPSNSGFQKGTMDLSIPCPLYRTSITLYLSWCYDPSLRLQGASNPLELGAATDRDMVSAFMRRLSVKERKELLGGL
ncbi:hypothetical protein GN958_ATG03851 [Phytophthora infestans]|uniref:Tetratricopeptide repeat protein n=1 Tax=Phytophthora infestans TaxID=4787 RepID=A0A8S9V6F0_PHYIN|nr:hypothetical protein GN958_ATG03851 [Phytophthora infestans]